MDSLKNATALIGVGAWGRNIFRNLHALGCLRVACDTDSAALKEFQAVYTDVTYRSSPEEVFKDASIKAVAIAAPAAMHFSLVTQALQADKDVFVEKPLALTVQEGRELINLAQQKSRILMVGHILQYHPAVLRLKEMVHRGELGQIRYIYSNRLNIGKLRTEENILWSFAPHDISVILMLLEEEPIAVSAFGGDYVNRGINDVTLTALEFKNGTKAHVFVSWLHPYKEQKLIVVGSKAMAVFNDLIPEKLFLYPHTIEWVDGKIPVAHKADHKVVPVENGEPLKLELEHFLDCVQQRKTPRTDGSEGLRVLEVLEKAENFLKEKKNNGQS